MPRILLIEDDQLIRKAVEAKLKKSGYEVIACENGKDGMASFESQSPDLVLTDVMLPYISGLEIVSQVKSAARSVPVIIFSSMGQEKIVEQAFDLGADDYITKPFSLTEVVIRIKKQLKHL